MDNPVLEDVTDQVHELRVLFRLTDRLYRARTAQEVRDAALDAIVDALGCERASILLFDATGVMRFVAWRGLSERYRQTLEGHTPWRPTDRDPDPIFVSDILLSDESEEVQAAIEAEGIRGLGFVPLVSQGAVVGKFMTYYAQPHAFTEHEISLAVTIARQVGFSLERARAERSRKLAEDELRESEARFRLMSEHAPVMIWVSDRNGSCLHLNRRLREFWAVDEEALHEFDFMTSVHPDDLAEVTRRMGDAVASGSSVTVKARYLDAEGAYRVLQTEAQPRFAAGGAFLGMIGVNVDVTEREEAEQALRRSEERFRLAVEAAPSGMVMTDRDGRITMLNANAERLFGYSRDELEGREIELLVPERYRKRHPRDRDRYGRDPQARAMGDGRDLYAVRKDGSEMAVEVGISPIETPSGPMAIASVVDISSRKRAEAQRELLLAELNHRVKNSLAVVQAIAYQTFKNVEGGARTAFEGRLQALARAHDLLTRDNWESASLEHVAAQAVEAVCQNPARAEIRGPRVLLTPKPALAIAMALHELCTNAVKYGALSNDAGRVRVAWRPEGEDLRITWREEGGPEVAPPTCRGFGTFLIERALAQDLEGTVTADFAPDGLVCTIVAPLPQPADAA